MTHQLQPDIAERIEADFPPSDVERARQLIMQASGLPRVRRCFVVLARGSLSELQALINDGHFDDRDIIAAGEGDSIHTQPRDMNLSFRLDQVNHAWAAAITLKMERAGFHLQAIAQDEPDSGSATADHAATITFTRQNLTLQLRHEASTWQCLNGIDNPARYALDQPTADLDQLVARATAAAHDVEATNSE